MCDLICEFNYCAWIAKQSYCLEHVENVLKFEAHVEHQGAAQKRN